MKKIQIIFGFLFVVWLLAACNIQTVEQYEEMEDKEQSIVEQQPSQETIKKEQPVEEQIKQEVAKEKIEDEQIEVQKDEELAYQETLTKKEQEQPKQEVKETLKNPIKTVKETVKKESEKKSSKEEIKQPNSSSSPTTEPKQPPKTEQPKKHYVTIAIRADTLLKNWDLLDASLQSEKYVPKSGVILKTTKYELLSDKETVWDVLKRATREHKIQLEYQGASENTFSSVYIEGINHLYEFSAGPLSGWMYKVNGVYPNYGCSQYALKDGDIIEWNYTVDLGRDLGQSVAGES